MKPKINELGNGIVIEDGKPVYIHDDGQEIPFDAPAAMRKITELNAESKNHRLAAKAAEDKLAKFGDLDPDEAVKAIGVIKNLDAKKLVDAGEVEKIKKAVSDSYEIKLREKDEHIQKKEDHIYRLEVSNRFSASDFIKKKLIIPPGMAESAFAKHFKIEDDKVIAYIGDEKLFSKTRPGELADFEEAIAEIISRYPEKDTILRGTGATGSGSQNQSRGDVKDEYDDLPPTERMKRFRRENS